MRVLTPTLHYFLATASLIVQTLATEPNGILSSSRPHRSQAFTLLDSRQSSNYLPFSDFHEKLFSMLGRSVAVSCLTIWKDPNAVRRLVKQRNLPAAPKYPKQRVLACLDEHLARQRVSP